MSALTTVPQYLSELLRCLVELASCAVLFVSPFLSPRAHTAATIVALSSQLAASQRRVEHKQQPRPRFSPAFRVLWVILSRVLDGWEDLTQEMKPAMVKRWRRTGFRLYWRRKSPGPSTSSRSRPLASPPSMCSWCSITVVGE